MCRFVCRKLVQIVQAEQPETRQLGAYLLPEKSQEISHGKRTFTFAASLAWLNFTVISFAHTTNSTWDNTEGGSGFFMDEEKGWILNSAIILVYSATQIQ